MKSKFKYLKKVPRDQHTTDLSNLKRNIENAPKDKKIFVLLGTGSYCPPHNMHINMFKKAKKFLSKNHNIFVAGGFLSPAHDTYTSAKLGHDTIHSDHRCKLIQLIIHDLGLSNWLNVDKAEVKHQNVVAISHSLFSLREYCMKNMSKKNFSKISNFVYVCGEDLFTKAWGFDHMQVKDYGVVVFRRETSIRGGEKMREKIFKKKSNFKWVINGDGERKGDEWKMSSSEIRKRVKMKKKISINFMSKSAYEYLMKIWEVKEYSIEELYITIKNYNKSLQE